MNREEILRNLECAYEKLKDRPTFTGEINVGHMISDVISFIKEDTDNWIPVNERGLPTMDEVKKNKRFLVTQDNNSVGVDIFRYDGTSTSKEYWERNVVAWQPLPEPYKGGDAE